MVKLWRETEVEVEVEVEIFSSGKNQSQAVKKFEAMSTISLEIRL